MNRSSKNATASWILFLALGLVAFSVRAEEPLYQNNFEQTEVGEVPDDFLVLDGNFAVRLEDGNRFLELPGAPLDSFGFMFGPTALHGNEISARMFGTKKGRRFPVFGVALNGVNGYRLQVAPAKRAIELLKGSTVVAKVPFVIASLVIVLRATRPGSQLPEGG